MTITFIIINPQTGNEAGVWMTSCPEEMRIWGFWKRVSWEWRLDHGGRGLSFCHWGIELNSSRWGIELDLGRWRDSWVLRISADRNITRCAARGEESDSLVSISFSELCLSPRVKEPKSEINKSFVPETIESTYRSVCICICKVYNSFNRWPLSQRIKLGIISQEKIIPYKIWNISMY